MSNLGWKWRVSHVRGGLQRDNGCPSQDPRPYYRWIALRESARANCYLRVAKGGASASVRGRPEPAPAHSRRPAGGGRVMRRRTVPRRGGGAVAGAAGRRSAAAQDEAAFSRSVVLEQRPHARRGALRRPEPALPDALANLSAERLRRDPLPRRSPALRRSADRLRGRAAASGLHLRRPGRDLRRRRRRARARSPTTPRSSPSATCRRPTPDAGARVRRLPGADRAQPARRDDALRDLRRGQLLQGDLQGPGLRPQRPRPRHRHRRGRGRGVPLLPRPLARAPRRGPHGGALAARRPERRRRLPLHHPARRPDADRRRGDDLRPRRRSPISASRR